MRTDVVIDGRKVRCHKAITGGYHKWEAQVGDIIIYKEYYTDKTFQYRLGRMAGRVKYAPCLPSTGPGDTETPAIRNWILIVALGSNYTFAMERWIDPNDVAFVYDPQDYGGRNVAEFMRFFFGPEFRKYKPHVLRGWATSGWTKMEDYLKHLEERKENHKKDITA